MASPVDKRLEIPKRPKPTSRTTTSQRLPPPSLFQGPPSRNNSHIALALPTSTPLSDSNPQSSAPRASRIPAAASFAGAFPGSSSRQPPDQNAAGNADRADALWAEMQNTLAEVELSAMNSSHVFGATHARVLEDLRTSQLALAQAWAKSEAEEMGDTKHDFDDVDSNIGALKTASLGASPMSQKKGDKEQEKRENLEEQTEKDIKLARKRREANDRYFQQVNSGVLDVVGKLEEVAAAMRRVEKESREIWSESDGGGAGSVTEGTETDALTASPG